MSQENVERRARKRRSSRRRREGLVLALLFLLGLLGVCALSVGAVAAANPVKGVSIGILGLLILATNRQIAELHAGLDRGGVARSPDPRFDHLRNEQPWYSPTRLITAAVGLATMAYGVSEIVGG